MIETYLEQESMKDKNEAIKAQAWNIWMTARCALLRAKVVGRYIKQTSESLGYCAGRAKYAKENWTEEHQRLKGFTNELKNFMNDVWKLCEAMRTSFIVSLNASRSKRVCHS